MTVYGSGLSDSGMDRALQRALDKELDKELASGELWPGELAAFPDSVPGAALVRRPWQRPISEPRKPPSADTSLLAMLRTSLQDLFAGRRRRDPEPDPPLGDVELDRSVERIPSLEERRYYRTRDAKIHEKDEKKRDFMWRPERVGIVMVHGIGPHLAGQTLLDWTRPIISLLNDAAIADPDLVVPTSDAKQITDPVLKSNIDFSGETFPVILTRIPRRRDVPEDDPRSEERTWVFTEAWWASEVRAPTLAMMIGWLGEQGGVGRIVQGIQENMLGSGIMATLGRVSLQPIVSVITSFVLLLFLVLLGIAKLIPFGPLRDAVVLRLAASFLTDWFGGARTLLLDTAQSANVRHRLLMTIKALRAYGCRSVVLVAHSGGTMVSLTTLTDPHFESVRVQKLITLGEALNLGWRLDDEDPDNPPPTPPHGDRMAADIGTLQPDLQWRDFWATHDPAPSGRPTLPRNFAQVGLPRFSAERVYNRMSITEDHGTYWDNDEHFLIPLIREIDVPSGDRAGSRFYSDRQESEIRARRKERVGLLALWRRGLQSLPLLAIVAAATVSAPGFVALAGDLAFAVFGLIPGNELAAQFFDWFVGLVNSLSLTGFPLIPAALQVPSLGPPLYELGTWALEAILVLLILQTLLPGRIDRLWGSRPWARLAVLVVDIAVGLGVVVLILAGYFILLSPDDQARVRDGIPWGHLAALVVVAIVVVVLGAIGTWARKRLRRRPDRSSARSELGRDLLITVSSLVLAGLLIALIAVAVGVILVVVDGSSAHRDTERFVVGAITVLVGFRLVTRLGTWRWDSWDARERQQLRRAPLAAPARGWPYVLAVVLSLIAFGVTLVVALGAEGSSWLTIDRNTWLVLIGGAILVVVVICLGKDIVDNDISVARGPGGGTGDTGQAPPLSTPEPPPRPAGS
jgi:hypothetical protein